MARPWHPAGRFGAAAGILAFVVATSYLVMWWVAPADQPGSGNVLLAPNTALGLALLGLATWAAAREPRNRWGRGLALGALAIALATLAEYALALGPVIDRWLVPGVALQPSLQTAASILFASLAVATLDLAPGRRPRPAEVFAGLGMVVPLLALLGYAYGITPLYLTSPQVGLSLPTAGLLITICLAVLFARPAQGWMAFMTGRTQGGLLIRLCLPGALLLPALLGWPILAAAPDAPQALADRVALVVVGLTLALLGMLAGAATWIDRLDAAAEVARADRLAALKEANQHLVQVNEYKDRLLGILSHELRTPLNFIMGFASVLEDEVQGPLNPQQHEAVDRILAGADRMTRLVGDLLDVARIQAGKLSLVPAEVDFEALAHEVLDELAPRAAAHGQALDADLDLPRPLRLDGHRMAQVLTNLLDNSLKFTPDGGRIRLEAYVEGGTLIIGVSDTGPGIPPAKLATIFERFTQVDMSSTRAEGGVGLGLAIARALVEAHGGTLSVLSREGAGSTFTAAIPLGRLAEIDDHAEYADKGI